jgi:site-specific recombinase XerD
MDKSISIIVNNYLKELTLRDYSQRTLKYERRQCNLIAEYCEENNISEYSETVGENFLKFSFPELPKETLSRDFSWAQKRAHITVNHLNEFLVFGQVTRYRQRRKFEGIPAEHQLLSVEFSEYLKSGKKLNIWSCDAFGAKAKRFLMFHHNINMTVTDITEDDVIKYCLMIVKHCCKDTTAATMYALKHFFNFLYETGKTKTDFSKSIPNFKLKNHRKMPSVWLREDVKKILDAVDRGNPTGKRDYAILLLVTRLGIRDGDVHNLKFENIDWDNHRISIIQNKTGQILTLPLQEDVGWAIIDYLRNARPITDEKYIFITQTPPYRKFGKCSRFGGIVSKYANIVGLNLKGRKHGLHSLRHTLATRLLEDNVPAPVISEILGHVSSTEVVTYLTVDLEHLRNCALNAEELFAGG